MTTATTATAKATTKAAAKTADKPAAKPSLADDALKAAAAAKKASAKDKATDKATDKPAATQRTDARLFRYAGASVLKGKLRLRFTNNLSQRLKTFKRDGDEEVRMIDFEEPKSKPELAKLLLEHEEFQDQAVQELLNKLVD